MDIEALGGKDICARLAAEGSDALRIASVTRSTWIDIEAALSPIIGDAGIAALFKRSVFLASRHHPCLSLLSDADSKGFHHLEAALSQQTYTDAYAASEALLRRFYELLTKLIGTSLTERLLQPVWDNPSDGSAGRES